MHKVSLKIDLNPSALIEIKQWGWRNKITPNEVSELIEILKKVTKID